MAAAKLLNRKYIGIDQSDEAINLCNERLKGKIVKTESQLLEKGKEAYNQKTESEEFLIKQLNALPVQRNNGIDAIIPSNNKDEVIAIKFQKEDETLGDAVFQMNKACKIKQIKNKVLLKNPNPKVMSLFDNIEENDIKIIDSLGDLLKYFFKKD